MLGCFSAQRSKMEQIWRSLAKDNLIKLDEILLINSWTPLHNDG